MEIQITQTEKKGYLKLKPNEEGCYCLCGLRIAFTGRKPFTTIQITCPECGRTITYG
jgi:hypothetical protein